MHFFLLVALAGATDEEWNIFSHIRDASSEKVGCAPHDGGRCVAQGAEQLRLQADTARGSSGREDGLLEIQMDDVDFPPAANAAEKPRIGEVQTADNGLNDFDDAWLGTVKQEYAIMQTAYGRNWLETKGEPYSPIEPRSQAHLLLLHGHLACHFGDAKRAVRSIDRARLLDRRSHVAALLLAKIHLGQGRFAKVQETLGEVVSAEAAPFAALYTAQYTAYVPDPTIFASATSVHDLFPNRTALDGPSATAEVTASAAMSRHRNG
jgi:hypothetical protein